METVHNIGQKMLHQSLVEQKVQDGDVGESTMSSGKITNLQAGLCSFTYVILTLWDPLQQVVAA